jgi:hypothetical protein
VVLTKDVEQLLGRGRLGECREAAQVTEEGRDVGPVAGQQPFAVLARDELRDLGRDEARELRALALDRLDQTRVRQCDRRLVGERLDERDVIVRERVLLTTHHDDDTDEVVLDHDRHPEHRAEEARPGIRVFGVGQDVRDLDRSPLDRGAAGRRRPVEGVRMVAVVHRAFRLALVRAEVEEPVLEQPQRPVVGPTESLACLGHLLEHGLQPARARNRAQDIADRVLPLANVLELLDELGAVAHDVGHPPSLGRRRRVVLATEDVERDIRLVADDPAVVAWRNVEEVAGLHHPLGAVVHLGDGLAAEYEPDVLDLARRGADDRSDVLGPAPARLVRRPTDRRRPNPIELEAPLLEVSGLGRLVEVDQCELHEHHSPCVTCRQPGQSQ